MTTEEKNILNLTRKNTTFNSHAPNLIADEPKAPIRLGCNENKSAAPLITVRPFVRDATPGKVHIVSPMRNGEVVTSFSADPMRTEPLDAASALRTCDGQNEGEKASKIPTDKCPSSSLAVVENNSSEESGVGDDHHSSASENEMMANEEVNSDKFSDTLSDENETPNDVANSFERETTFSNTLTCDVPKNLSKNNDLSESLSNKLSNSLSINFEREASTSLSSTSDDGEASNEHSSSSSSTSGDDDTKFEKNKCVEEEEVHHQHGRDYFHATARLSFLHSTIQFEDPTDSGISKDDQSSSSSSYNSNSEENSESSSNEQAKPKVKITRKSPYVVGPYASTAILKGTPKPSVNIRKPPVPKEKPKVPLKPEKFLQNKVGPIPTPRQNSFRNVVNEVTISDESKIQLFCNSDKQNVPISAAFECYSAVSDVQNALIIDVCGSGPVQPQEEQKQPEPDVVTVSGSNSVNSDKQQQRDLSFKNREALEAIRKSLSDKLAEKVLINEAKSDLKFEGKRQVSKFEESKKRHEEDAAKDETAEAATKKPIEKTISNTSSNLSNFEMNRSAIANALEFNRIARPSTKRQAPKPPQSTTSDTGAAETSSPDVSAVAHPDHPDPKAYQANEVIHEAPNKELPAEPLPIPTPPPPPPAPPMPKSALSTSSAGRHSSMKGADSSSPKNREVKNRVQFSPETTTVTLPPNEDRNIQPISYNRWIHRGSADIIESSFTGQPINVPRPAPLVPVVTSSTHPTKRTLPPVTYAPMPQVDDEVRRWTEKKQKQRSKSLPRGSEIDEMMGSSKQVKSGPKLFPISVTSSASASNVRRQSRVELYEAERKHLQQQLQQQQRKGKFSLKKFFKMTLVHNPYGIQFPPNGSNDRSKSPSNSQPAFLDKEHEREILEREKIGSGRKSFIQSIFKALELRSCASPREVSSSISKRTSVQTRQTSPAQLANHWPLPKAKLSTSTRKTPATRRPPFTRKTRKIRQRLRLGKRLRHRRRFKKRFINR